MLSLTSRLKVLLGSDRQKILFYRVTGRGLYVTAAGRSLCFTV